MELIYKIGIYGIFLLGIAHCLLTFKNYKKSDENAYWFFSAGLALIVCGILNNIYLNLTGKHFFYQVIIANTLLFIFSIALSVRVKKITMYLVSIFSLILLVVSILIR
ncbi:MAG: hypothetical protein QM763_13240 [Agriterribacter sp.]